MENMKKQEAEEKARLLGEAKKALKDK